MRDRLILLNKPFNVLCHFTDETGRKKTLADFVPVKEVYAAGRLDYDSEGLVVLTNAGWLQNRIASPAFKEPKEYWVQVEGIPNDEALKQLGTVVTLNDGPTLPAKVTRIAEPPGLWARTPPIRERKNIPVAWLAITLREGRNRQVRRMTAAVGHPTLRLIRAKVGEWALDGMQPGQWREAPIPGGKMLLSKPTARLAMRPHCIYLLARDLLVHPLIPCEKHPGPLSPVPSLLCHLLRGQLGFHLCFLVRRMDFSFHRCCPRRGFRRDKSPLPRPLDLRMDRR